MGIADKKPRTSWLFMPATRSILMAIVFLASTALIINLVRLKRLDPQRPDPGLAVAVIGVFAVMGFFGAVRGGATIDNANLRITRWWGPFFPVRESHIPFDAIRSVRIGPGLRPGQPQAAHAAHRSYHAAVQTDKGATVVRLAKDLDDVRRHASLIADAVGCTIDETGT
jgi:hypothetical protein